MKIKAVFSDFSHRFAEKEIHVDSKEPIPLSTRKTPSKPSRVLEAPSPLLAQPSMNP